MALDYINLAFNAGEFSPRLDGRSDLEKYYSACRTLKNMICTRFGPAERRPGLQFVAEVKDSTVVTRLLPFKFSTVQAYILEMGDQNFRFYKDRGQIQIGVGTEDLSALDNIVAHWPLNDDTTTQVVLDDDGTTHNGVASINTNILHDTGTSGTGCFNLGGNDYVTITDHLDFSFDDTADEDMSIMAWVHYKGNGLNQQILSKETTAAQEWLFRVKPDGTLSFRTKDESANKIAEVVSDSALTEEWNLVCATYENSHANWSAATAADYMKLYVNGALVASTSTTETGYLGMEQLSANVYIGSIKGGDGPIQKWADKIDNVAIFSDVLTAAEIAALYSSSAYEITSPYLEADLFGFQRIQSADVMYGFHSSYNPRKLSRFAHDDWTLESIVFDWPPFRTENVSEISITPSGRIGSVTLTSSAALFTSDHIGSSWLIRHNRTDNKIEKTLTAIATLTVLGDAANSYAAAGVTDILVDVKGSWRVRTSSASGSAWIGTIVVERSYDGILTLVLDSAPASGAWSVDDIITGGTSGDTCIIVSVINTTHYRIKQLTGSFTDGETLTAQDSNARNTAATWPRYEGWHTLETFQTQDGQDANITGEETLGDAYLRVRRTVDSAGNDPTIMLSVERFYWYGIAKVTAITSSTVVTATVTRALGATTATKTWSEGAWSTERGYPSSGAFHEERLMAGGTVFEPHRLDGSKTNEWENFRSDSVLDNDSVSYSVAANEMNAIRWLISKDVLLLGTAGAEWKLGPFDTDQPLTPDNPVRPRPQTTFGSKKIQAIMIANVVLFVVGGQSEGAPGRVVRGAQYVFDQGESGGYDAPDYTTFAEHITESGIVSMAYQQVPEPILWCVLGNGKLIGMTFEPGQKVWGWFNVVTDGEFEDVAVIPGVSEDEVWVIVKRTLPDGTINRNVEYFKPRDWGSDQKDCFFVDSGLTFDGGAAVTITGITQADPCVVTAVLHGRSSGDKVRIRYVGGMSQVRNRVFTATVLTDDTFDLRDDLDTTDINSTAYTAFSASITGDTTYDSKDVTNVSAADIAKLSILAPITGTGIPSGTTVTAIGTDRFTMSAEATVSDTSTITIAGTVENVANTFTGMGHLEGKTCSVLGDGSVHADVVIASGAFSTTEYYNKVHAGLPYDSDLLPMKPEVQTGSGTLRSKIKKITQAVFSFHNTIGCSFGSLKKDGTVDKLDDIPFRKTTDATGRPVPLFTGEKLMTFPGEYGLEGNVFVRQDKPLPLTVRTIVQRMTIHG